MVPLPLSSGERPTNGRSRAPTGNGKSSGTSNTPRKDGGAMKERAMPDPGLKDYVR